MLGKNYSDLERIISSTSLSTKMFGTEAFSMIAEPPMQGLRYPNLKLDPRKVRQDKATTIIHRNFFIEFEAYQAQNCFNMLEIKTR